MCSGWLPAVHGSSEHPSTAVCNLPGLRCAAPSDLIRTHTAPHHAAAAQLLSILGLVLRGEQLCDLQGVPDRGRYKLLEAVRLAGGGGLGKGGRDVAVGQGRLDYFILRVGGSRVARER